MRSFFVGLAVLSIGVSHAGLFSLGKVARVRVDSISTEAYQARRADAKAETYHFFQGRHFEGAIADGSLKRVSFIELATALAKDMEKKNYFIENDPKKGDLFIVVHWGVTAVEEDWEDLLGVTSGDDISTFGEEDVGTDFGFSDSNFDFINDSSSQGNIAKLLGYDRALRKKGLTPSEEYELLSDLEDERYFIIMMAYDYQTILADKEFKLLWSTRFSLRSIGTNFEEAYLALSRGAIPYFGENLDGLTKSNTHYGKGEIDFGDLEIIEKESDESEQ